MGISRVKHPAISFITPLFNQLSETQAMLASLRASLPQELDYELILVDDGSTDGTRAWLATLDDARIRVYLNPHNLGFARSCNAGVALARGTLIGLLNNDLLFAPGWLAPMLAVLHEPGLRAGLVGNVQFRVTDGTLDHAGVRLNLNGQFEHIRQLPMYAREAVEVLAVTGACMLLHKADFNAAGGFEECYVNGAEDIDLCLKLREAGKKIYLAPGSRIQHHVSLSRQAVSDRDERNSRALFTRWRAEIKRELAREWVIRLSMTEPSDEGQALLNTLTPAFLATPHTAARTLAEAMLQQQEQRWACLLDGAAPDANLAARCNFSGLRFDAALDSFVLTETARLTVNALPCARNLYVCGRTLPCPAGHGLRLHIDINGLQRVQTPLRANTNFNAGLTHPLLLNGAPNVITLRVDLLDAAGQPCGSGHEQVAVGHCVVDEQVIQPG
nr:glycosyltransferase family 2 protein [Thauera aromatica]